MLEGEIRMKRFSLKNKSILITGGSGFFGKQIIVSLLKSKANVINVDTKKFNIKNKNYYYIKGDVTKEKELEKINKRFKKIDVIINNAAIDYKPKKKSKLKKTFSTLVLSNGILKYLLD